VVDVPGCGNDVVDAGETCDGTDDAACPQHCTASCTCATTQLRIAFVGKGKWRQHTISGIYDTTRKATVTWSAVYLVEEGSGLTFAGDGTLVEGTSEVTGSIDPAFDCNGPIVVNTDHGDPNPPPTAQTPFLHRAGIALDTFRVLIDTLGGYDYRACNGEDNLLVGPFVQSQYPGTGYAPAIGIADQVTYSNADWFGAVAPHSQTFLGLGATEAHESDPSSKATACWNGAIQLSTDLAAPLPSAASVPEPGCL
jgi:hypothetical protein